MHDPFERIECCKVRMLRKHLYKGNICPLCGLKPKALQQQESGQVVGRMTREDRARIRESFDVVNA